MLRWHTYVIAALFAVYFPVGLWLDFSYVPEEPHRNPFTKSSSPVPPVPAPKKPNGSTVVELSRPFERFGFLRPTPSACKAISSSNRMGTFILFE
jgi:hypothetical protein